MPSELAVALAKAQGEMQNASINKENPHFHSRYADLSSIRDATIPSLSKHGLAIFHAIVCIPLGLEGEPVKVSDTQWSSPKNPQWIVRGTLAHGASGETLISDFPLPNAFDKPQIMGSAITYGRRYTWAALCGIAAEEDDDANATEGRQVKERKPAPMPSAPPEPPPPKGPPHEIPLLVLSSGANDWISWAQTYLSAVKSDVPNREEWAVKNLVPLKAMEKEAARVFKRLNAAMESLNG